MSVCGIQKGRFTAQVDTMGAQLVSLADGGRELLWVGDPAYWREHAPVLFPIVGALRGGRAQIQGKWVEMAQHGFAKRSAFEVDGQGDGFVSLVLRDNAETREMYPFPFALTVRYDLLEDGYRTSFTVENTGDGPLPYCIGGHPGFNFPLEDGAAFEDYTIQFPEDEKQQCPSITDRLLDYEHVKFSFSGREIPLRHNLFAQDALVFSDLHSQQVRIVNKSTGRGVEMDFSGFPMLGIWSAANDGPYVCLEPWMGCATLTTESDDFCSKRCLAQLAPGARAEHRFTVRVL